MEFAGPGATIVRLVPEVLMPAEEAALTSVALTSISSHVVGYAPTRAVGFPAWPIITDPANAHHALNLVGDLEWAKRTVASSPDVVQERFDELITMLAASAPHFVPALLEELARLFTSVDDISCAKKYFGKAREIERTYDLQIDAERHAAMFTEFANLGIVGARKLSAEAKAAGKRMAPSKAFDYFLNLSINRIHAGAPIYAGLTRDLRNLAKAAGMNALESDEALLDGIIDTTGFLEAPATFFTNINASFITLTKTNPTYQEALLAGKPYELSTEAYLTLLEEAGIFAILTTNSTEFAQWLAHFITTENRIHPGYEPKHHEPKLTAAVTRARDALATIPITLIPEPMDINLIDALCACNVTWDLEHKPEHYRAWWFYKWLDWFDDDTFADPAAQRRDLAGIAQYPQLGEIVAESFSAYHIADNLNVLLATDGRRRVVRCFLEQFLSRRIAATGYKTAWEELKKAELAPLMHPRLRGNLPRSHRTNIRLDPVAELQQRLHHGVISELTWPALEQTLATLLETQPATAPVEFFETYSAVALRVGDTINIIDGNRIVATGSIPADAHVTRVSLAGNKIAVLYDDATHNTYTTWIGETPIPADELHNNHSSNTSCSLPLDGGRLTGQGLITYPNKPEAFGGRVWGTGPHYCMAGADLYE